MAFHTGNYVKRVSFIISVYYLYKNEDIPDSEIVKTHFPKHHIFINYRQWMNIKGMVIPKENIINNRIILQYEKLIDELKPKIKEV